MTQQKPILAPRRLRIETLSALHIGSGDSLGLKDYARQRQDIIVTNREKVLALAQRSAELERAFLAFCEDERQTLKDFLRQQRIRFDEVAAYRVRSSGQVARRIPLFIKDIHEKPYIPGSSLKGAIRSAIYRSRVIGDQTVQRSAATAVRKDVREVRQQQRPNLAYWRKRVGMDAERTFFGKDEHHDLMRLLHVGDSTTRNASDLMIAEVGVLSVSTNGNLQFARYGPQREMRPLTPEILPKGVEVFCSLVVNHYLLSDLPPSGRLDFERKGEFIRAWLSECNSAAQNRIQQEISFFSRHPFDGQQYMARWYELLRDQLREVQASDNQCLLHLGWGSGWDPKTITDQFDDQLFDDLRRTLQINVGRPRVENQGRLTWGQTLLARDDSPKSRKILLDNGRPQEPLGWVKVTIVEEAA